MNRSGYVVADRFRIGDQGGSGRLGGASLVVTLILLIAISLIGISTAHIALLGEKSSRNDRDRQIAFQAAEVALLDAEMDIGGSPDAARTRSTLFASRKADGFIDGCGMGEKNISLGLCMHSSDPQRAAWLTADFLDASPKTMKTVPYGMFTGQPFEVGKHMLPARLPRYIIELMPYGRAGESAAIEERSYIYRITAVGFGTRDSTRVMLQTIYRKE
jgi:type IV pilus assembly protein PilX